MRRVVSHRLECYGDGWGVVVRGWPTTHQRDGLEWSLGVEVCRPFLLSSIAIHPIPHQGLPPTALFFLLVPINGSDANDRSRFRCKANRWDSVRLRVRKVPQVLDNLQPLI